MIINKSVSKIFCVVIVALTASCSGDMSPRKAKSLEVQGEIGLQIESRVIAGKTCALMPSVPGGTKSTINKVNADITACVASGAQYTFTDKWTRDSFHSQETFVYGSSAACGAGRETYLRKYLPIDIYACWNSTASASIGYSQADPNNEQRRCANLSDIGGLTRYENDWVCTGGSVGGNSGAFLGLQVSNTSSVSGKTCGVMPGSQNYFNQRNNSVTQCGFTTAAWFQDGNYKIKYYYKDGELPSVVTSYSCDNITNNYNSNNFTEWYVVAIPSSASQLIHACNNNAYADCNNQRQAYLATQLGNVYACWTSDSARQQSNQYPGDAYWGMTNVRLSASSVAVPNKTECRRIGDLNIDADSRNQNDWICVDHDEDRDGVLDADDSCYTADYNLSTDVDHDGCDDANEDQDDDNDGWSDTDELACNTNGKSASSIPLDTDSDKKCDVVDTDDDNDGWLDINETTCGTNPFNAISVPVDTDGDGICNVLDLQNGNLYQGQAFQFQLPATGAGGSALVYELIASPQGMYIDANGVVRWVTPYGSAGSYEISVRITDNGNVVVSNFSLDVLDDEHDHPHNENYTTPAVALSAQVGAVNGEFSVSSNGTASYIIPIEVPPGTNGMQPELALAYGSQQDNGLLGVGWNLSGLHAITRCPQTLSQDGHVKGVSFGSDDRFCLDGERLMLSTGIYGANGAVYHTERESFTKVISHGTCGHGPCSFDVWDKQGRYMEFGHSTDSRIAAHGRVDNTVVAWALGATTDLDGNYVNVSYVQDALHGGYHPSLIEYGNSDNSSPRRKVEFSYADRSDLLYGYVAGSMQSVKKRIVGIRTYVGNRHIKSYKLDYQASVSTGRSQIKSVQECDGNNRCLPKTEFTWHADAVLASENPWGARHSGHNVGLDGRLNWITDVNADGYNDYVYVRAAYSTFHAVLGSSEGNLVSEESWGERHSSHDVGFDGEANWMADVNGDGLNDYVYNRNNTHEMWVMLNTGSSFAYQGSGGCAGNDAGCWGVAEKTIPGVPLFGLPSVDDKISAHKVGWMADMNGDGRADFVFIVDKYDNYAGYDSLGELWVMLSDGSRFETPQKWGSRAFVPSETDADGHEVGYGGLSHWLADVTGDGLPDYIYGRKGTQEMWVLVNKGHPPALWLDNMATQWGERGCDHNVGGEGKLNWITDVNGDGLADYVYTRADHKTMWVLFSTGKAFTGVSDCNVPSGERISDIGYNGSASWMADVNGDNLPDFIYNKEGGRELYYLRGNGHGFDGESLWGTREAGVGYSGKSNWMVDINGDGLADYLYNKDGSDNMAALLADHAEGASRGDGVQQIINGIGERIAVEYSSLVNTHPLLACAGCNSASFPVINAKPALDVVTRYTISDGGNQAYPFDLQYVAGKMDLHGRGWLGFRKMSVTDVNKGVSTINEYRQDFPYIGLVEKETYRHALGGLIQETETHYSKREPAGGRGYLVLVDRQVTVNHDGGNTHTAEKVFAYGAFGNVISVHDKADINHPDQDLFFCKYYDNDTDKNIYGILRQQKISASGCGTPYDKEGSCGDLMVYPALDANDEFQLQSYGYDEKCHLIEQRLHVSDDSSNNNVYKTAYDHDSFGNVASITDEAGNTSFIEYDDSFHTFPVRHVSPPNQNGLALVISSEFDAGFGVKIKDTDPNGNNSYTHIDGFGRVVSEAVPDDSGQVKVVAKYDRRACSINSGRIEIETSRLASWASDSWITDKVCFDAFTREVQSEKRTGNTVVLKSREYNHKGELLRESLPYLSGASKNWINYAYDIQGRIIDIQNPDGSYQNFSYANALPGEDFTKMTAMMAPSPAGGDAETREYQDSRGKVIRSTNANGKDNVFEYNVFGQLLGKTDPLQETTEYDYYDRGGLKTVYMPSRGTTTYAYNVVGDIASQVDARNNAISYSYDKLGRILTKSVNNNTPLYSYYYDNTDPQENALGQLSRVAWNGSDGNYSKRLKYNHAGNVKQYDITIGSHTYSSHAAYDPLGRQINFSYPDASLLLFSHKNGTLLSDIELFENGNKTVSASYSQYNNPFDVAEKVTLTNGITTTRRIDKLGRLEDISTGSLFHETYEWDASRKLSGIVNHRNTSLSSTINYDDLGVLTGSIKSALENIYAYNDGINITEKTSGNVSAPVIENYVYDLNKKHQLKIENSAELIFHYDANGNLKCKTPSAIIIPGEPDAEPCDASLYSYAYDAENRLVNVTQSETSSISRYVYDEEGYLLKKIDPDGVKTIYVTPQFEITELGGKVLTTKNVMGPDGLIASVTRNMASPASILNGGAANLAAFVPGQNGKGIPEEGVSYYHADYLGSTRVVTNAVGNVRATISYDPYGNIEPGNSGGLDSFRYKFTGKEYDAITGLYYFGQRFYDPQLARFLTPDPAWQYDSPYIYGGGDPFAGTDPDGQFFWLIAAAIGGAYFGGEAVNHDFNPGHWNWSSGKTWAGVLGGGALGAVGGAIGEVVSSFATGTRMLAGGTVFGVENTAFGAMGGDHGMGLLKDFGIGFGAGFALEGIFGGSSLADDVCCFVAGTKVLTKTGHSNIEDIVIGDLVYSKNVETGEQGWKPVTQLFEKYREIYELRLKAGDKEEKLIETTDDHPFYVIGKGWIKTIDLLPGDIIETSRNVQVTVHSVVKTDRFGKTYNLEIADFHTYYATELNLLVHNCKITQKVTRKRVRDAYNNRQVRSLVDDEQDLAQRMHDIPQKRVKRLPSGWQGGSPRREAFQFMGQQRFGLNPGNAALYNIRGFAYQGGRNADFALADQMYLRDRGMQRPQGTTWHHLHDFNNQTGRGSLVLMRSIIHDNIPHSGGVWMWNMVRNPYLP